MSAAAAEIQPVATLEKERLALADGSDSLKGSDELELELEHAGQAPVKRSWFRGTLFQTMVIGVCSFLSPGLWNAVNSTGGGGAQEPYLINAGNSLVFGGMWVFCALGSAVFDKIGVKWALVVGCIGYVPYSLGLYFNKTQGIEWVVLFGAALCGISAGIFWATEGALILGYPEARKRGVALAIWLAFKSGGQVLGGAINVGLNIATKGTGSVSSSTYLVFIALQCLAPFSALLLSPPEKVQREDGTKVVVGTSKIGFWPELKEVYKVLKRKEVLTLMPLAFFSSLLGPYTSTFLGLHFSVRSRALASLVTAILNIAVNFALGFFLDSARFQLKTRARWAFAAISLLGLCTWIWGLVLQVEFSSQAKLAKYDWVDPGFARAWTLYLLWTCVTATLQSYLYFVIGGISRDPIDIGRLSSILRSIESAGSAVGYGLTARKTLSQLVPLGIDVGFFGFSTIIGWWSIREIGVSISGGYDVKLAIGDSTATSSTTEVALPSVKQTALAKGEASLGPQ